MGAGHNGDAPEGYVPKLFGRGRLAFTVDQGQHTQRYQGVVPLEGATLADCAHTYFRQSEQLPTGIKIAARRTTRWRHAPLARLGADGAADAGVRRRPHRRRPRAARGRLAQGRDPDGLGDRGRDARSEAAGETLLHRLFHAEQPRLFARRPFVARCRCSRERIDRVLRSIKREELDDLRDTSGRVAVKCEFCSTEYTYDDRDLDRIYASAA